MSRLGRLPTGEYARLKPEQQRAVDRLRYLGPDAAGRGAAKRVLGWRQTEAETIGTRAGCSPTG